MVGGECLLKHFNPRTCPFGFFCSAKWILLFSQVCPPCVLVDNHFCRVQALLVASIDPVNPPALAWTVVGHIRTREDLQPRRSVKQRGVVCTALGTIDAFIR